MKSKSSFVEHAPYIFVGFGVGADITIHVMESYGLLKNGMVIFDTQMKPTAHKTLCFWSKTDEAVYQTLKQCVEYIRLTK